MRRAIHRRIKAVCAVVLLVGWGVAWAAVAAVQTEPDLLGLPWMQIGIGAAIASWGGGTATLGRYLAAQYGVRPFYWRVEVARDSAVSVTIGAASYLAGAWYGLGPLGLGLVLLLSGYLGVRVLNTAAERLLDVVRGKQQ